jgi:transcription elongation GreA/GreB family factor
VAHGDLALANANGSQADGFATFQCTGNATVKVRAIASPANPTSTIPVRSDSSITSRLTVNNADGATGVTIPVVANQAVTVTLKSTLSTAQPTAGALLGSAALVLDFQ